MRVFVTGATGVIGRRVVPLLVAGGHRVSAVGRTVEKQAMLQRMGAAPIALDLFDPGAVHAAVAGQDAIINLATHMPASTIRMLLPGVWRENDRIRREASALLAQAGTAAGVRRFIQESFAPVYADGGDTWIEEDWPVRPAKYNRTILDAERSAARFTERGGVGVVLRFAGFYGPDAFHIRDFRKMAEKGWSPLPGAAEAWFSSISHDDAATATVAALSLPAGIYNVTDDRPVTRREYADTLSSAIGARAPRLLPAWTARLMGSAGELMSRSQRISNRKLKAAASWKPKFPSVREGLLKFLSNLTPI